MSDYTSGYDPKYGYNKNAFAHKTMGTAVMGQVVKLIATPIGLVSEAVHSRKSKAHNASRKEDSAASLNFTGSEGTGGNNTSITSESQANADDVAYVHVTHEEAHELIASGQAEPADGQSPTHKLVAESDGRHDHEVVEYDEADWALDETVDETEREDSTATRPDMPIQVHGAVSTKDRVQKLPFPVILPQRRPGTKTRGFVRAYPPVLGEIGISQDAFIWFLKEFHKSAQASPIFDVIIVATAIAAAYPDPLVGLGIQAVQIAAAIGQEIQERLRTNNFLNRANKDIFIPKGMYAMIVTYKKGTTDQTTISSQPVDLGATAIAKYDSELLPQGSSPSGTDRADGTHKVDQMKEKMKKLRIASGETHGEAEMPVICAPLIFPGLDAAAKADAETENEGSDQGTGSGIKTKSKDAQKFVNDYFDRRAKASYAYNNQDSTLTTIAGPATPFKSRYADPNNATNTHLFTLITGGRYKAEPLGARRRWEKAQRKAAEKRAQGIREKPSKRLLQEDVLYLMVVDMPTEAQVQKARDQLQAAEEKKAADRRAHG